MSFEALSALLKSPVAKSEPQGVGLSLVGDYLQDLSDADFDSHIRNAAKAVNAGAQLEGRAALSNVEVKVIDSTQGIVDYIASDETLDSYREAIKQSGWQFNRFKKNAPFVDSHDYGTIGQLVGKVTDYKVQGSQLIERVQWAKDVETNQLAKFGFDMTEKGYLKAVSVGFFPVKMATRWDGDETAWQAAVSSLKLSPADAAIVRAVYLAQEQIELSACIIGANGNAVAKAYKDGALTDEGLDTLTTLAQKKLSRYAIGQKTGSSPSTPAGDDSQGRARSVFLRELETSVGTLRTLTNRK